METKCCGEVRKMGSSYMGFAPFPSHLHRIYKWLLMSAIGVKAVHSPLSSPEVGVFTAKTLCFTSKTL